VLFTSLTCVHVLILDYVRCGQPNPTVRRVVAWWCAFPQVQRTAMKSADCGVHPPPSTVVASRGSPSSKHFFFECAHLRSSSAEIRRAKKHVVDGNAGSSRRILGAQCGQPPPNCDKLVHACAKVGRSVRILLINVIYLEFELIALKSNNVGLYM